MLGKSANNKIYCGLDIGSRHIKAGLLKVDEQNEVQIIGVFETLTQGFKNGSVSDLADLAECLHYCLNELINKAGVKIKDVFLGINGDLVDARVVNTMIPLVDRGNKIIAMRDVKKINEQAKLLGVNMEEEMLHHLPQEYQIDDDNFAINPVGLYGRKLGARSLMVVADINSTKNIVKAVNQAGFDAQSIFFSSYAAGDIILNDQQKKDGAVLIDIGSNVTSVLVFKDGTLKFFKKIERGGDHFTNIIAHSLELPFDLAEEIKKSYAVVSDSNDYQDEEILVKRENKYIPIKRELVCVSIAPEIQSFVQDIYEILEESRLYRGINDRVYMIGGGAMLPGLMEVIEKKINLPVELGQIGIVSNKSLGSAAIFSSVIGLAQKGFAKSDRSQFAQHESLNWRQNICNKVKELYHEYF